MKTKMLIVLIFLLIFLSTITFASIYCNSAFCLQVEKDNSISGVLFKDPLIEHLRPELKAQIIVSSLNDPLLRFIDYPVLVSGD